MSKVAGWPGTWKVFIWSVRLYDLVSWAEKMTVGSVALSSSAGGHNFT